MKALLWSLATVMVGAGMWRWYAHEIVHPIYLEVDQIYNMACPASPPAYQYNAIKTIKTSTVLVRSSGICT